MRVAIIIGELGGGGAERAAQVLGNYLIEQGHQVIYFVFDTNGIKTDVAGELVDVGINIEEFAMAAGNRYCFTKALISNAAVIKRYKKAYSIDVAISFMEESNYLNIISKCTEKVVISVRTAISYRRDLPNYVSKTNAIKKLYPKADAIVAVSEFVKNDLIDNYGLRGNEVTVISNPAIRKKSDSIETKAVSQCKNIVCVARLDPVKQHDRIIRAFSIVASKEEKARLILVGDGRLRVYLEWIANRFGILDKVEFVGYSQNVEKYLSGARAFVMASQAEGFPNAMVEAMAYGVPIISTDSPGGCGEIIGKDDTVKSVQYCEYGVITPYIVGKAPRSMELEKEEVELGQAMLKLVVDDVIYEQYVEASLRRASDYSYKNEMSKWQCVLVK